MPWKYSKLVIGSINCIMKALQSILERKNHNILYSHSLHSWGKRDQQFVTNDF